MPPGRAFALLLRAAAAALAGWAVLVLYRGPGSGDSFGPPAPHWLIAAAALAWAGSTLARTRGSTVALGSLAFAVTLLVLVANDRLLGSADTRPTAVLPFSILRHHSLALPEELRPAAGPLPFWMLPRGSALLSRYPIATAILATPLYFPSAAGAMDPRSPAVDELEKLAAALLTALGAALVAVALARLVPRSAALVATGLYVVGTPLLPVVGQALWQHTGAVLCLSLALWALVTKPSGHTRALLVGLAVGAAAACRPIAAVLSAGVLCALLLVDRRGALLGAAWALLPLGLQLACNRLLFGQALATGYGAEAHSWLATWPDGVEGITGLLVSPTRGLFLLAPLTGAAAIALFAVRPASSGPLSRHQLWIFGATFAAYVVLLGHWWAWHGGFSAGPRLLSDALPLLAPGLALFVHAALEASPGPRAAAALLACASVGTQILLAEVEPTVRTRCLVWLRCEGDWRLHAFAPFAFAAQARDQGPRADVSR